MQEQIPKEQNALQIIRPGEFEIQKCRVPVPQPGQVLVKITCAPLNPSDVYFMNGLYDQIKKGPFSGIEYPLSPGWEGSGVVVQNGGGILGWKVMGKRVAVSKCNEEGPVIRLGGCYQEYMITNAYQCIELPNDVSFEEGSMHCVNPLTALGLLDRMKSLKAKCAIVTAACSQLGKMINRIAIQERIPIINIVRRQEQVETLKKMGCVNVLLSEDTNFENQLAEMAHHLQATVCFECVAGETTGKILSCMPMNSICILYGLLSEQPVQLDALAFMAKNQKLEPFLLNQWLMEKNIFSKLNILRKCTALIHNSTLKSEIREKITLWDVSRAIMQYKKNMGLGKFLIFPQLPQNKVL